MNRARYLVLIALLTFTGSAAGAQTTAPLSRQPAGTDSTAVTVNAQPQSQLLRILTPVASQQLSNNAITVRFEMTNPAAYAGTPNFLVQLDGSDPMRTSTTSQTFTGLAAGSHSVTVILVDVNNTPIPGGRASVQFTVAPQNAQPATTQSGPAAASKGGPSDPRRLDLAGYTFQKPDPDHASADADLPKASSPLPLISVIGFGILVGGIVSAMKTRS